MPNLASVLHGSTYNGGWNVNLVLWKPSKKSVSSFFPILTVYQTFASFKPFPNDKF